MPSALSIDGVRRFRKSRQCWSVQRMCLLDSPPALLSELAAALQESSPRRRAPEEGFEVALPQRSPLAALARHVRDELLANPQIQLLRRRLVGTLRQDVLERLQRCGQCHTAALALHLVAHLHLSFPPATDRRGAVYLWGDRQRQVLVIASVVEPHST